MDRPPIFSEVLFEKIPQEMQATRQWLMWKAVWSPKKGKWDKIPHYDNTHLASSTDASKYLDFPAVVKLKAKYPDLGVGFAFNPACSDIMGIDLDGFDDHDRALVFRQISKMFNSYQEFSPSRKGVHIYFRGKKGVLGAKPTGTGIEYYDNGRFFTVTGKALSKSADILLADPDTIGKFEATYFPQPQASSFLSVEAPRVSMDAEEIIRKMLSSGNSFKIKKLFDGDITDHGGDRSSADMALANHVAFYTQDLSQFKQIMKQSKLYREKWDRETDDYLLRTFNRVISTSSEFYTPSRVKPLMPLPASPTATIEPVPIGLISKIRAEEKEMEKYAPKTGFPSVDAIYSAFIPKRMSLLTGDTNVGKTAFCCNLAINIAAQGKKVIYMAFEPNTSIIDYLCSIELKKPFNHPEVLARVGEYQNENIFYYDKGSISSLQAAVDTLTNITTPYDVVFIDHVSYFTSGSSLDMTSEESQVCKTLKQLCITKKIHICFVQHINKTFNPNLENWVPSLNSIKGSTAFKQDSDDVIVMARKPIDPLLTGGTLEYSNEIKIFVAKSKSYTGASKAAKLFNQDLSAWFYEPDLTQEDF
jgi:replicative DNA helicase